MLTVIIRNTRSQVIHYKQRLHSKVSSEGPVQRKGSRFIHPMHWDASSVMFLESWGQRHTHSPGNPAGAIMSQPAVSVIDCSPCHGSWHTQRWHGLAEGTAQEASAVCLSPTVPVLLHLVLGTFSSSHGPPQGVPPRGTDGFTRCGSKLWFSASDETLPPTAVPWTSTSCQWTPQV